MARKGFFLYNYSMYSDRSTIWKCGGGPRRAYNGGPGDGAPSGSTGGSAGSVVSIFIHNAKLKIARVKRRKKAVRYVYIHGIDITTSRMGLYSHQMAKRICTKLYEVPFFIEFANFNEFFYTESDEFSNYGFAVACWTRALHT